MFKKSTRVIAILVCAVMILSFCSCGKKGAATEDTIVWYMQKPVSDMSHQSMVEEAANKIISKELGVKLKFEFVNSGSWAQKKSVLISSGEHFDIISEAGASFINNASKNAYVDLTEYLKKNCKDILEKTDEFAWDAVTVNGKICAIPSQTFYVPYSSFAIKKDIVEKYNIDYKNIQTLDDLEPVLKTIHDNEPGMYAITALASCPLPMEVSNDFLPTTVSGVVFDKANDKFIPEVDSEYFQKRSKKANEFYKKGYIPKDAVARTETISEIKSGKYAVFAGRRSAEKTSNLYGFQCVETEPTYGPISSSNVLNCVTAISRTSKNPEKALQLLNLIWKNRELSNLLAYGIENVDYTVASGKGTEDISVLPKSGNEVKWSIWHNWLGPLWDQWDSTWNTTESLNEMRKLNETAEVSPIIGFYPDLSDLSTEYASVSAIIQETGQVYSTGSMPNYDEYNAGVQKKLKDAGIDKVIDSMQKQYNKWKKTK